MVGNAAAIISAFILTIAGWLIWSWYATWLDVNFLWKYVALLVSVITVPLALIALPVEWVWHGRPDVAVGAAVWGLIAVAIAFIGEKISGKSRGEMKVVGNIGFMAAVVVIIIDRAIYLARHIFG